MSWNKNIPVTQPAPCTSPFILKRNNLAMKHLKLVVAIGLVLLGMSSCQKEISRENRPIDHTDSTSAPTGLLMKKVETYLPGNFDWFTTEYDYDSSRHISNITLTQKIKQADGNIETTRAVLHFFRDNIRRVTRIGSLPDTSSINTIIAYENSLSQKVTNISVYRTIATGARLLLDSTVFEYNSNDLIAKTSHHKRLTGNDTKLLAYQQYLYDNEGNMIEAKLFQDDNGDDNFQVVLTYQWELNTKINPEYFNEAAYFFLQGQLFPYSCSPHLVTRQLNYYHYPGGTDDQVSYTFQYDASGRVSFLKKDGDADNETRYYYY